MRDSLVTELDCILTTTEEAIQLLSTSAYAYGISSDMDTMRMIHRVSREYHRQFQASILTSSVCPSAISPVQVTMPQGRRGRPSLIINIEQVELFRSVGYGWLEISNLLSVSRTTLWRRFRDLNLPTSGYSDLSDEELDHIVQSVQQMHPNVRLVMLQGHVASQGIRMESAGTI